MLREQKDTPKNIKNLIRVYISNESIMLHRFKEKQLLASNLLIKKMRLFISQRIS